MRFTLRFATCALLLLAGGLTAAGVEPPAQVAVSPSRFELEIGDTPRNESLSLFNFSEQDVAIEVSIANWDLDEDNAVRVVEPTEQSLDQWIIVNPLRFTVPAKQSQTVRFSIRPRVRPAPGEHRAMIYFDQVLPEDSAGKLRVRFRVGVAIYGWSGELRRAGKLHAVEIVPGTNPVRARLDISSEGSSHLRLAGQYAIWPAGLYPGVDGTTPIDDLGAGEIELPAGVVHAGLLPARPILPDTRRALTLQTSTKLPPGSYVLDLNGEIPGDTIDVGVPFTIPHPARVSRP